MESKATLRREARARRVALASTARAAADARIAAAVAGLAVWRAARVVALYRALPDEPDLDGLMPRAWAEGRRVVVPVWDAARAGYAWREATPATTWTRGRFGITEPVATEGAAVAPEPDVALVPGVAFAPDGVRLGRGAGYYDRLLAGAPATRVGIAYACQRWPALPRDTHDQVMDWLVTEDGACACRAALGAPVDEQRI